MIAEICGPVQFGVFLSDESGSSYQALPEFVTFDQDTNVLSINTDDESLEGTYYLLFESSLSFYYDLPSYPSRKDVVKLTLQKPSFVITLPTEETIAEEGTSEEATTDPDAVIGLLESNSTESSNSTSTDEAANKTEALNTTEFALALLPEGAETDEDSKETLKQLIDLASRLGP